MPRRLRIATVQSPITINPAANGATLRDLMRRAYNEGARLVHMPEGAVSGHIGGEVDWKPLGDELAEIADLAAGLGIWVVAGSHHRLTPPNRPHSSLYVISDQGVLVDRYDKRYLPDGEVDEFFTPGRDPVTFTVDGFTFGLLLCVEVNVPELWAAYAEAGVDCILFSSYAEDPMFELAARDRAATTMAWVSVSVPARVSHAMPAGVIGPHGDWLATGNRSGLSDLVLVDLDDSVLPTRS
ncbi:carbon-nitrogen hydrolase family protein [Hamadaea sp. NPDC050747]|uniref:carbon-nitrogen hydrolase family protein n=1 Tax=Hamadaea sp. NPDC050747 TaxID=3155789 RepID=UPI00340C6DFC